MGKKASMPLGFMARAALLLYDLCWQMALPGLRLSHRLAHGFHERTLRETAHLSTADIWIQAASVGEAYLAWTLLKQVAPTQAIAILLSTNTPQGMEILEQAIAEITAANSRIRARAVYFPFDRPSIMERMVRIVNPKAVVFIETEIWPGLLGVLKKNDRQAIIINGRMMPKSLRRYRLVTPLWRRLYPSRVLAVSQEHARRFIALFGNTRVETMPNMKFDQVASAEYPAARLGLLNDILDPHTPFVVFGSVRHGEASAVEAVITAVRRHPAGPVIGLFPRHVNRVDDWKHRLDRLDIPWALRSGISRDSAAGFVPAGTVIIWDVFGELKHAYAVSKAAFVGGSLIPAGGHNFLEPLFCGVKPIIGPYWEDFSWVGREIIANGLVRKAANGKAVEVLLLNDLNHTLPRRTVRREAAAYIESRLGGADQAWNCISKSLYRA